MSTTHNSKHGVETAQSTRQPRLTEVVLPGVVEPEGLQVTTRPLPAPGRGQVRISVEATGVSFAEQQMRRGKYYDQPPFPFVPGYDLVGTVTAAGPGVDSAQVGRRYAAVTKTGGWASDVILDAADLIPVPDGVDPAEAETLVVNGITAWAMLHRIARVQAGQTVLVLGANGGVGSTLVQLARLAGATVIGTASTRHHDAVRALGATPLDYRDPDVPARVRELAPGGVDAVLDHIGGPGIVGSYRLLAPRGTLVAYGSASTRDAAGSSKLPILATIARLAWWNALPNGHTAHFFNIWAGQRNRSDFRARMHRDLSSVFTLLVRGQLSAQVAARIPLTEAARAMRLAESGTVRGKVVLIPDHPQRPTAPRAA
jgi:NADPH:quinone reductase-like Zn-dependent oxidoreductase